MLVTVKAWRSWQNWVAVAAGLYAALSPIWTPMGRLGGMALISGGLMIVAAGVLSLGTPIVLVMNWTQTALGAAVFVSPWVLMYSDSLGAAITAWITGLIAAVVGGMASMRSMKARDSEAEIHNPNYDAL